jgi:ABC-type Mn2+/Zn2+ transport system permease subunit
MFAGGIALMSAAQAWRDFTGLLFGSVVSVGAVDLLVISLTTLGVLFALRVLHKELELASFDEEYAELIGARPAWLRAALLVLVALGAVACVRLVGALLTTALFVIPSATGVLLGRTLPQVMGWGVACAVFGGVSGLYLSYHCAGVPSGAGIVLCCALPYLFARLRAPRR